MKRNKSIDVVAGLMIIYMIFTHVCQLSYNTGWPIYITSLNIFYSYMFFFSSSLDCFSIVEKRYHI